jgi:hypothetical protein
MRFGRHSLIRERRVVPATVIAHVQTLTVHLDVTQAASGQATVPTNATTNWRPTDAVMTMRSTNAGFG